VALGLFWESFNAKGIERPIAIGVGYLLVQSIRNENRK
jgi:hypothetical protein